MSTATPALSPSAARTATSPQWLRVARIMLHSHLVVGLWTVATVTAFAIAILAIVSRSIEPSMSALQYAPQILMWVHFGVNIVIVTTYLRPMVAAGMTRRSFIRAAFLTSVVAAIGLGLVSTALVAAERAITGRLGWTHGFGDGTGNLVLQDGVLEHAWGAVVLLAIMGLCGFLVGATFMRLRVWAVLLLPLTVGLPFAASVIAIPSPRTMTFIGDSPNAAIFGGAGLLVGLALQVVIIVAVAAATWFSLRDIPVHQPTS